MLKMFKRKKKKSQKHGQRTRDYQKQSGNLTNNHTGSGPRRQPRNGGGAKWLKGSGR